MAVTVSQVGDLPYRIEGAQKRTVRNVAFDSSYPTDGESVTAAQLGLNRIEEASVALSDTATTTVDVAWAETDIATGGGSLKIVVLDEDGPVEITDTSDIAGLNAVVTARGY